MTKSNEHESKLPDSTSLSGLYFGLIGVFLSAVGIALSVYALNSGGKSLWLSLSGWISSILTGIFLTRLCVKLIHINTGIHCEAKENIQQAQNEAKESAQRALELTKKVGELEYAITRLTEINSFIVSTTSIPQVKARRPTSNTARAKKDVQLKAQTNESEEVTDDI
ncbi:hypothetical protein [Pseudomonas sp. GXZC]|uniref:hypothetical protein n=1 Tax=Pseudomonas sp. GXZC TaxID=3003351 RepID=UPI0022AA7DE8|nr:hypothetical protein [Pseudomonas sp. GXZC]WAT26312.1 hypothetical protein OZ428_20255 [Pseudomonas sp. GXZC]